MEAKRRFRCCCERYKTCEECRDSEGALRADEQTKVLDEIENHIQYIIPPEVFTKSNFAYGDVLDKIKSLRSTS